MTGSNGPVLTWSGNPRIPKGDSDAPVQAYIAAMPGWKREIGRRIDAIVAQVFPQARRAVRWNTPLYGKDDGWFLAMYCHRKYVQLTFMQGASLDPVPPVASKVEGTRYLNIREEDGLDEAQIADWVTQASRLPGVRLQAATTPSPGDSPMHRNAPARTASPGTATREPGADHGKSHPKVVINRHHPPVQTRRLVF